MLVALWPVPEKLSRHFLVAFYVSLLRGLTASAALRHGVSVLRKTGQNPGAWGAWAIVGDGGVRGEPPCCPTGEGAGWTYQRRGEMQGGITSCASFGTHVFCM